MLEKKERPTSKTIMVALKYGVFLGQVFMLVIVAREVITQVFLLFYIFDKILLVTAQ